MDLELTNDEAAALAKHLQHALEYDASHTPRGSAR
jgi:hypothetical protein